MTVQALTHGNEVCGAIALDWLLAPEFRPTARHADARLRQRRRLRSASTPGDPFASRCVDEDFNRLWTADVLDGPRQIRAISRARASCGRSTTRIDYLLDLHSMTDPCPPLALAGRQRKGVELAHGARHAASTSSSTAATPPASGCATTRSSTIPTIRATRC